MTTIAFDTSTASTVAAVSHGGAVSGAELDPPPNGHPAHSGQLLAALQGLLHEAGAAWTDVTRIGVGAGPGTFTGLRIAAATSEGLRRSTGAPVVPVSSLMALALPAIAGSPDRAVCSLIDARRGEVFAAGWSASEERIFGPIAVGPEGLVERLLSIGKGWLVAGCPPGQFAEALSSAGVEADPILGTISAEALCRLAEAGDPVGGPVVPEYVRQPDAVKLDA